MSEARPGVPSPRVVALLGAILVAGVAVRLAAIPYLRAPFPADAAYYYDVAKNLATGRGLVIDYVWMYDRGVPDRLPVPSNGYWMPGMSLYLAPWLKLLGTAYVNAQVAATLLSVPFMALVWWIGREMTGREGAGLLAAALAAVHPELVFASISTNASLLQGLFLAGCLACLLEGFRGAPRWLWAAGLLGGLAHFSRNDSALVLVVVLALAWRAYRRREETGFRPVQLLYFAAPYALVMGPWLLRNTLVFGAPSPPDLPRLTILPRYEDIFRTDLSSITPAQYLAAHGGWVGALRYDVLVAYRIVEWIVTKAGSALLVFALPFLWVRRPAAARPFLYLFGLGSFAYAFVVPEVGRLGGYTQAFTAVLPVLLVAAAGGVWLVGEWTAARLRATSAAVVALLVVLLVGATAARLSWALADAYRGIATHPYIGNARALRGFFRAHPPFEQPVLTSDPWQFHAITGRPCLMIPTDGQAKVREVAERLGVRYLVLTGAPRGGYPGLQGALDRGEMAVVRALPTLAPYGGLQVFDLHAERVLAEARRLNEGGRQAAERGEYRAAIGRFEAAAKLVADYPKQRGIVATNLARARRDQARAAGR